MLVEKLWNDEITIDIVKNMIAKSIDMYNDCLRCDLAVKTNRDKFTAFISDDIYEFDSIMRFARTMIDLNLNMTYWISISDEIRKYNMYISENEHVYKVLNELIKYYQRNSIEFLFLNKIINSSNKSGINLKHTRLNDINKKIQMIENKLAYDFNENPPKIILSINEIGDFPNELIGNYYDPIKKVYELPLDKQTYLNCHKYLVGSDVRKKVDDKLCAHYEKNIPKLTYLFIYKHAKSNLLGYDSYLNCVSGYSKEQIRLMLEDIIISLKDRCELEIDFLSKMKMSFENEQQLSTWDISYYVNKWKILYGINECEISHYFEVGNTVTKMIEIISKLFSIQFIKVTPTDKVSKLRRNFVVYKILQKNSIIGEVTLDLFARDGKNNSSRTTCINNNCEYPYGCNKMTPVSVVICMNLENKKPALLQLSDLACLINNFGKLIYFISCNSNVSLFGGMYSGVEVVETFGKLLELIMFEKDVLKILSYSDKSSSPSKRLSDELIEKILQHRKLDYGLVYKYQCLYGLYDLFVHSQTEFISDCKNLVQINNADEQKEKIIGCMKNIYNLFHNTIFNTGSMTIYKDPHHFHPVLWTYLFNGNETVNFLKILSDVYAHELFTMISNSTNKPQFCQKLTTFISENITKDTLNIGDFIGKKISPMQMLNYFGLNENDASLSLYNIGTTTIQQKGLSKQQKRKTDLGVANIPRKPHNDDSLYMSPEIQKQQNHFEQMSENDPNIKQILNQVMR